MNEPSSKDRLAAIAGPLALLAITAFAAWMRFDHLGLKALHHDEGVNAQFTASLVESFRYRYNPFNFHGPLLYFLTYPVVLVTGITDVGMRIMPATFGTLAIPAMALFRRSLGWMGVLAAALIMAVAPVEVYFSKTAIHEIYNFTFNLTFVGGLWLWWRSGKRWALLLGAASLACLFATKETTIITVAAVVPSLVVAWLVARPSPTFVGGAPIPARLVELAPAFWARRVRAEGHAPEADGPVPWPPEEAPRSVHAAQEALASALDQVQEAARAAVEAQRQAEAQAEAGALPAPPPLPWSVREEARGPQPKASGRHWAIRIGLLVYGLLAAAVVGIGVTVVEKKLGLKIPEWGPYAGAGGVAGLGLLFSMLVPSDVVWWLRWTALPFAFLRAAWTHDRKASRWAVALFLVIVILLFSSFFTHMEGLGKFFQAFFGWGETGVEGKGHEKVWYYWIESVLWPYYKPLLFIALPALVIGAARRHALAIFSLGWFLLALAAYSAIPYKTPWCVISFTGPLFIGVGLAMAGVVSLSQRLLGQVSSRAAVAVVAALYVGATANYTHQSMKIQLAEYDVDYHSFIYVQNLREYFDFVSDVRGIMFTAKELGLGPKIWMVKTRNPLRYYVDGIADAKGSPTWDDKAKKQAKEADLVMANRASARDIKKVMQGLPYVHRWYHERPGQKYDVFIRKPLYDAWVKNAEAGKVAPVTADAPDRTFSDVRSKEYRDAERAEERAKKKD